MSPTLNEPIAMAYIAPSAAGAELSVAIRGQRVAVSAVDLPFYKRAR
jgi:glycine cleavage system aminomethyltransferase T